ncbi:hypothetical protein M1B72_15460 [Geomonas paludis]|uniref:Uncharacterized protein n=1 Tax=Geomonas paludis TaxID=2740185 RepID=A0A6V8MX74_9BACT|nr:hypothetical protein [Geomonas paludis]UPU34838.1 hypothetical protein M1B72_15460 [Geomonas paludis]GFO64711.1 hypothetical protein GMPD_26300 [Geomonas paludis]
MEKIGGETILRTQDVTRVVMEVPKGHRHLRTTLQLADGSSITLQEATVAAIVRAYVTVKTDPVQERVALSGRHVDERKDGYAEWQLMEEA